MENNFIKKFETNNFMIGSFDTYQDLTKSLIKINSKLSDEEVYEIIKSMPTTYRTSIVDKNENYIGYIGIYNVQAQYESASIRFETNKSLDENEKNEILAEYKTWLSESLNLNNIEEYIYCSKEEKQIEKNHIEPKANIIIPSRLLEQGISIETLEYFQTQYDIPKMQMPFSIKNSDKVIGIIGLTNLIWSNRRANLNIYLDKALGDELIDDLSSVIIDEYLNYVHNSNIHNVTLSVSGSDKNMLDIIKNTNMNFYAQIPFSSINGDNIESKMMFQHIPNIKNNNGILIPDNKIERISLLETEKKELEPIIKINDEYKLVSPKVFEENNIDSKKIIDGHINAMQNRQNFSIPLGEDKYILQKGNDNYGISKAVMNYNYVLLNNNNNYSGYINILRNNANNKNAEIEIGIDPKIQGQGIGTQVINKFYEELFSIGYASVTSAVFEFNNPSIKLHEKVAEFNGIRLESYYINGKLWNMNFYTKTNELIDKGTSERKI